MGYDGLWYEWGMLHFVPGLKDMDEFLEWFVACAYLHHVDVEDVCPVGELYIDLVAFWC